MGYRSQCRLLYIQIKKVVMIFISSEKVFFMAGYLKIILFCFSLFFDFFFCDVDKFLLISFILFLKLRLSLSSCKDFILLYASSLKGCKLSSIFHLSKKKGSIYQNNFSKRIVNFSTINNCFIFRFFFIWSVMLTPLIFSGLCIYFILRDWFKVSNLNVLSK